MYIHTHTHTHKHTYIDIHIDMCACMYFYIACVIRTTKKQLTVCCDVISEVRLKILHMTLAKICRFAVCMFPLIVALVINFSIYLQPAVSSTTLQHVLAAHISSQAGQVFSGRRFHAGSEGMYVSPRSGVYCGLQQDVQRYETNSRKDALHLQYQRPIGSEYRSLHKGSDPLLNSICG